MYNYIIYLDLPFTLVNLMKPFSAYHTEVLAEDLVFYMSVGFSITNGLGRPIFGFLYDKFGLSILKIVAVVDIVVGAGVYFTSEIGGLFFVCPVLAGLISGSLFSITPPSVTKVFGIDNSAEVNGSVETSYELSALLAPILSKVMSLSTSDKDKPYLILLEVSAGLALIGLLILFTMNEEPFDYNSEYNKKIEQMKKANKMISSTALNQTDIQIKNSQSI